MKTASKKERACVFVISLFFFFLFKIYFVSGSVEIVMLFEKVEFRVVYFKGGRSMEKKWSCLLRCCFLT